MSSQVEYELVMQGDGLSRQDSLAALQQKICRAYLTSSNSNDAAIIQPTSKTRLELAQQQDSGLAVVGLACGLQAA